MYPDIAPSLKVQKTISDPLEPAKVYGFEARNSKLGRTAIVLKEDAITDTDKVAAPSEFGKFLTSTVSELVVLTDDVVLAMATEDFDEQYDIRHVKGGGHEAKMYLVDFDSPAFRRFPRREVEVSN